MKTGEKKRARGDLAVVLVDMQTDTVKKMPKAKLDVLLKEQVQVVRMCATHDIPLIVLRYRGQGRVLRKLAVEIVRVKRVFRLTKSHVDGFVNGRLHVRLQELGAKSLLFTGVDASHCVADTAVSAVTLGYEPLTTETLIRNTCQCHDCQGCLTRKTLMWFGRHGFVFERLPSLRSLLGKDD